MVKLMRLYKAFLGLGAILCVSTACAPTVSRHGYLSIDAKPSADIKVGDTRIVVVDKLGEPSQKSFYDPFEWYYIDQTLVKMTYKPSRVSARNITKITFDPATQVVASVEVIDLKDGRLITPDPRKTPTRGRTLSALEQVLGTVGRQRISNDDDNPDKRRRPE
jgi:outer membrane protein assembly factor BamE (lipoprotein component of BamABCDE complex)